MQERRTFCITEHKLLFVSNIFFGQSNLDELGRDLGETPVVYTTHPRKSKTSKLIMTCIKKAGRGGGIK